MTVLSVDKLYALAGQRPGDESGNGSSTSSRPRVLQLRLPAEMLNQLIERGGRVSIENVTGAEPILAIDDIQHVFQRTAASTGDSPLHLHVLDESSGSSRHPQSLEYVGEIQYKLSAKSHSMPSSSITSKLKERRELEEARKTEHRAVLLDAAPSTKKSPATTKLKLKPKGLASASNSPLMRSRAATPIDSGSALMAGSKSGTGTAHSPSQPQQAQLKSSPLKRDASPNGLRRQLLQLLALGPLSRRQLVQKIPFAEPQIASMLPRLATTPEHLQPSPSNGAAPRKFTGPVNRRSQQSGASPVQSRSPPSGEHGLSTVYALTDEAYREVLIKDWPEYDAETRVQVSALMESALDRLGMARSAIERNQIVPAQHDSASRTRRPERGHDEEMSEGDDAGLAHETSPIKSDTGTSKKPTTKQRLAKAAKGRLSSSSTASLSAKAASNKPSEKVSAKESAAAAPAPPPPTTKASKSVSSSASAAAPVVAKQRPTQVEKKAASAQSTRRSSVNLTRTTSSGSSKPRKDIEYTDSSEEEEEQTTALTNKTGKDRRDGADTEPREARSRQPVGRGAMMSEEPWLEVRNEREWHELAKRFKRLYDEYQSGLSRIREEEEMLRRELVLARAEAADEQKRSRAATRRQTRNSISSGGGRGGGGGGGGGDAEMLDANDEREEGEASPIVEQGAAFDASNALESGPFAWRSSHEDAGKADRAPLSKPMMLVEIDALVTSVLGLEGQLQRMKSSLQSSKERLEA